MASDELFALIKSMHRTEKRYFKVFASVNEKKGVNIFLKLFEAMDKQSTYDEKAIKEKFRHEKFIHHLTATKYYLLKLILKSLRSYHSADSEKVGLNNALTDIEILHKRGLFDTCLKLIHKWQKTAIRADLYTYYLELTWWEKQTSNRKMYAGTGEEHLNQLKEEEKKAIDKLRNIIDYDNLKVGWTYHSIKKGTTRNIKEKQRYSAIAEHPLMQEETKAITNRSRLSFYALNVYLSKEKGDIPKSIVWRKKMVDFFKENPDHINLVPEVFASAIINLANGYLFKKQYTEALKVIDQISLLLDPKYYRDSKLVQADIFANTISIKTVVFNGLGEYKNTIALVPEFELEEHRLNHFIGTVKYLNIIFNFSSAYLAAGDYKKSLFWLNKILNHTETETAEYIHCFARIVNLVLHYEMKDEELLEYIVRSTYRYLYKRDKLYKVESSILNFIRRSSKFDTEKKLLTAFKLLRTEFAVFAKDPYESRAFEYFDLISWLDSKIEKRSIAEIVKGKSTK